MASLDFHDRVRDVRPAAARHASDPIRPGPAALLLGLALLIFAGLLTYGWLGGHSPMEMLRDPAQQLRFWPFTGMISHLGVLILWSAGSLAIFVGFVSADRRALLTSFGAFTLLLAVDDLFMLHDYFWPRRGVPPYLWQGVLGLIGLALLATFREEIASAAHTVLYLALAFLALSLAIDLLVPFSPSVTIVEDAAKFAGYVLWSAYWISVARGAVSAAR